MDLNQVTVGARDFDASLAFYRDLGLKLIVLAEGRYARFELPSGASTFSIERDPDYVAGDVLLFLEVEELDRIHAKLAGAGITFETAPQDKPYLWREARLRDPAGNRLCLYHAGANRRFPPWRLADAQP